MRTPLALALLCLPLGGCLNIIAHSEAAAAKSATAFARAAFVEGDEAKAYGMLAPEAVAAITREKFAETLKAMHPKGRPTQVEATEFEPIPGQAGMHILLKGTGQGEEFYYRVTMGGTATAGYKPLGLYRGSGPYPSARKKPLPK